MELKALHLEALRMVGMAIRHATDWASDWVWTIPGPPEASSAENSRRAATVAIAYMADPEKFLAGYSAESVTGVPDGDNRPSDGGDCYLWAAHHGVLFDCAIYDKWWIPEDFVADGYHPTDGHLECSHKWVVIPNEVARAAYREAFFAMARAECDSVLAMTEEFLRRPAVGENH